MPWLLQLALGLGEGHLPSIKSDLEVTHLLLLFLHNHLDDFSFTKGFQLALHLILKVLLVALG